MKQYKTKHDVVYKDLQSFNSFYEDNKDNEEFLTQKMLLIFYGIRHKNYLSMKVEEITKLSNELSYVLALPTPEFQPIIEHEGKKYGFIPDFNDITAAELIDLTNILENEDFQSLTSILYRPIVGKVTKDGKYNIGEYNGYTDNFANVSQYIVDGYMNFFDKSLLQLQYIMMVSSQRPMMMTTMKQ